MIEHFDDLLENRTVIVDTSTLLLTGTSLLQLLPECMLVVPSIVVKELEEKRTQQTIGFLAREWLRLFEQERVKSGMKLTSGVRIDGTNVTLRIEPNHSSQKVLPEHLRDGSNDSTILAVALNFAKDEINDGIPAEETTVVLLSNDNPMRLHATLDLGIEAYEFNASHLMRFEPYSGFEQVTITQEEYEKIVSDMNNSTVVEHILDDYIVDLAPTNYVLQIMVDSEQKPVLEYIVTNGKFTPIHKIRKQKMKNIVGKSVQQDVAFTYLFDKDIPVVSVSGGAGTGKTIVSMAAGLGLVEKGDYSRVIVFRSLHEMGKGQELGFIPGDLDDKMSVWAGAVKDAVDVIAKSNSLDANGAKRLREMVVVQPITYLRGRNLTDSFVILDEAQNFSRNELLNIISRAGIGTKMVLCFDASQVDNKYLQSGRFADIWSVVESLKDSGVFAHVNLVKTERSRVAEIAAELLVY